MRWVHPLVPLGKANELPIQFKEDLKETAWIKYEDCDDYLCFWCGLAFHSAKPTDPRNAKKVWIREDEIDEMERHFEMNIKVDMNDGPEVLHIDRRSICKYNDALNLMRYNNHLCIRKIHRTLKHATDVKKMWWII